ncbi:MAG: carboxylate--amine ligase [Bacillota bacterium]|nr:carboxylate--amine ligase [Bacillota bacterium]
MKNKAIVLGANYYIALSVMRNLGKHNIEVIAMEYSTKDAYALKSKYCSGVVIVPHYKNETEKFIEALIKYGKKQDIKPVLMPCADPYVEVIDAYSDRLKEYYLMPDMKQGQYKEIIDKDTLSVLAKKYDVLIPKTIQMDDENLFEEVKDIGYPCLVKPTNSHQFVAIFRKKMFEVNSEDELKNAIETAKDKNMEIIIQQIIPGFDDHMYTYDAYMNDDFEVTHWLTCHKLRQFPINYGASAYTEQKYVKKLHEIGKPFFKNIGYKGFAEIEFKKHAVTGEYYLIEINVRYSNLNELLTQVGINMPYITYMDLIGKPVPNKHIDYDSGLVFRYTIEDVLAIKGYLATKQLKVSQVIKSLFRKKVHAIRSWDDTMPVFAYSGLLMKKVIKKIF